MDGRQHAQVANHGSSECANEFSDDGTLIGLYLLIAGIILVLFTLAGVFLQKHCGDTVRRADRSPAASVSARKHTPRFYPDLGIVRLTPAWPW